MYNIFNPEFVLNPNITASLSFARFHSPRLIVAVILPPAASSVKKHFMQVLQKYSNKSELLVLSILDDLCRQFFLRTHIPQTLKMKDFSRP